MLRTSSKTGARRRVGRTGWASRAGELPGARGASLTLAPFEPQLAQLGAAPPAGERWIHESKFDGYRLIAQVADGEVRLWTRNAVDWTRKLPTIAAALQALDLAEGAFDGELVVGSGRPDDFNALQAALAAGRSAPLRLVLFDLLHVDGVDVSAAPLVDRKAVLEDVLAARASAALAYSTHVTGHGPEVFEQAQRLRLEGIVSKRADAPYRPGRGNGWQKTKHVDSEEFAAVGYTRRKGQRTGFSSLLLARPTESGWAYAGRVGSGFSQEQLREISRRIADLGGREPTAEVPDEVASELREARWFPPLFVVDAFSRGRGRTGVLRQASLKDVRLDRSPEELRRTSADRTGNDTRPTPRTRRVKVIRADLEPGSDAAAAGTRAGPRRSIRVIGHDRPTMPEAESGQATEPPRGKRPAKAAVSSPDKLLYPDDGISKQAVADYYLAVMGHLLPEVRDRPLSIIRCPDGATGTCFFQKHGTAGMHAVGREQVKPSKGDAGRHLVVRDAAGLMELVQHNTLEFHPWGAPAADPDHADRIVFDLDPGPGVDWPAIQSAARQLHGYLRDLGLVSFLRTSGGKGLHVVVPLRPAAPWDAVKAFAKGFAVALAAAEPERYVATISLAKRPGKIFVDYLRNGRGATAVASYSLRARPGAPVAMPIGWDELAAVHSGDAFTMGSALRRLATLGRDPWEGIDRQHQALPFGG